MSSSDGCRHYSRDPWQVSRHKSHSQVLTTDNSRSEHFDHYSGHLECQQDQRWRIYYQKLMTDPDLCLHIGNKTILYREDYLKSSSLNRSFCHSPKQLDTVKDIMETIVADSDRLCRQMDCLTVQYDLGTHTARNKLVDLYPHLADWMNRAEIIFNHRLEPIEHISERFAMGDMELVANLGGNAGVLFGFSLLSVALFLVQKILETSCLQIPTPADGGTWCRWWRRRLWSFLTRDIFYLICIGINIYHGHQLIEGKRQLADGFLLGFHIGPGA